MKKVATILLIFALIIVGAIIGTFVEGTLGGDEVPVEKVFDVSQN